MISHPTVEIIHFCSSMHYCFIHLFNLLPFASRVKAWVIQNSITFDSIAPKAMTCVTVHWKAEDVFFIIRFV